MAKPAKTPRAPKEDPGISALKVAKKNLVSGKASGKAGGKPVKAPKGTGKPAKGAPRTFWARVKSWAKAVAISTVVGSVIGTGIIGWVSYRWAERRVAEGLSTPVWSVPGKVWSGPVEVWPGLAYTAEALAADLSAAGYARVAKAEKPGEIGRAHV